MEEYIVKVYNDCGIPRECWFNKADQLHRLDGPACIMKDEDARFWYQNGKLHRLDGPAVENARTSASRSVTNEYKEWWIEGKEYSEEEFLKATQPATELTVAEIAKRLGINNLKIVKE